MDHQDADNMILKVAQTISKIVPNCCGVTLGGSRAYGFEDSNSDVEMYFYSPIGAPKIEDINDCMKKLGAKHKRCDKFLWNEGMWGPHSFFEIENVYFEIGYRNIHQIEERLALYQNGKVEPLPDCHDLGLGYMLSGLAASVDSEKEILLCDTEIAKLKQQVDFFSANLVQALKTEYLDTARNLLNNKLLSAAKRSDIFFYDVISIRIIRAMVVMAFAISQKHFPGDKWNEYLLLSSSWDRREEFLDCLKQHSYNNDENLLKRRNHLVKALSMIEEALEKTYGAIIK